MPKISSNRKPSSPGKTARARRRERQSQQTAKLGLSDPAIESENPKFPSSRQTEETFFDSDHPEILPTKPTMVAKKQPAAIDIISRFPPKITHHLLSFLPDPEKIRFSGVCKSWENRAKLWQEDNSQQIKKIYPSLSNDASFDWKTFKKTVKSATLHPSSRPSGKLETKSTKVHYHNSKKYVAWIDDQAASGDLWVGTLRRLALVEPGKGRIETLDCHSISELLEITEYEAFAEILAIDDETGIVVVAVGQIVTRDELVIHAPKDLQVGGFRVKDTTRVMTGFFGFDIKQEKLVWTRDANGEVATLRKAPKEEAETYFVKDYVYGYTSGNILFKDGFFIKATTKIEERLFSLWHMNIRTGEQRCVQNDVLGQANFPFNNEPGVRLEPKMHEADRRWRFRWDYKCDSFDIKMLPFRDLDGKQEYAAITWSMDLTNSSFDPDFLNHAKDSSADLVTDGPNNDTEDLEALPGSVMVTLNDLRTLGLKIFPSDWDMEDISHNIGILNDPENEAVFGDGREDFLCRMLGEAMLGVDQERNPSLLWHTCVLIINVNTGKIIENLTLPPHQVDPKVVETIRQNKDCTHQEYERAEIVDMINGTHGLYLRYPIGMQVYMQEPEVDVPDSEIECITLNIVQYTGIQRICSLKLPPFSPFHLPESWNVTIKRHKNSATPSFEFTDLSNCLYKINSFRFSRGPPKFIINPSYKLGLDTADFNPPEDDYLTIVPNPNADWQSQPIITFLTGNGDEVEVLQPILDVHAEILKFQEVKDYSFEEPFLEGGPVWKMKWMETVKKLPIMHPVSEKEGGMLKRIGWKSQFGQLSRSHESDPIEIGENGIKFGGLWVWN